MAVSVARSLLFLSGDRAAIRGAPPLIDPVMVATLGGMVTASPSRPFYARDFLT